MNFGKLSTIALVFAAVTQAAPIPGVTNVIEFSEVTISGMGPFPLLAGTTTFAPLGLLFEGSAHLVTDSRFLLAGMDNEGVSTTQCPMGSACFEPNPQTSMTFVFSDGSPEYLGADFALFYWIATGESGDFTSSIHADWFDETGTVIQTDVFPTQPTPPEGAIAGQFGIAIGCPPPSCPVPPPHITKVTFTGEDFGRIGVGRVEFTPVFQETPIPEPATSILLAVGVLGMLAYRNRCKPSLRT